MEQAELTRRVRELRAEGRSPKEIARALGVAPSVVTPVVRALAAQREEEPAELAGCWINVGWSHGLTVDESRGWVDEKPGEHDLDGLVSVLVARKHGWDKFSVCGYLADTWCLGVKAATGPGIMDERELRNYRPFFFEEYPAWQEAPIELARHIVYGSVDYAGGFGFDPNPAFTPAADHLGPWQGPAAVTFGRSGQPYYVSGPGDDHLKVIRMLEAALGPRPAFDFYIHGYASR